MKVLYQGYSTLGRKIHTSENTIDTLDIANETKYLKIFKQGKITIEEIAGKNHEDGLMYKVTILDDLDMPVNHLNIVHENEFVGVSFLDDAGREYLTYHFTEIEPKKKLFLHEVWYNEYSDDETEDMDYYLHFVFDREGNAAYRKYDEIAKKTTDYESSRPFDISDLYEDYPEFGKYENLIRLERDIDILNDFINK
jgi:hypothetical protein